VTLLINDSDFQLYVGDVREQLRQLPDESVHTVVTSPPYWGLRDYGTGAWDGGDPDCDHDPVAKHIYGCKGCGINMNDYSLDCPHCADRHLKRKIHGTQERDIRERDPSRPDLPNPPGSWSKRDATTRTLSNTCAKCGATRVDQQLGLEPTPEQYVANMVDVFREVRRVLRRDGTCWVNLGDSYAQGAMTGTHGPNSQTGTSNQTQTKLPPRKASDIGLKPKDLVGIPWRVAFALQADGWYLRSDIIWTKPNPMPESVTDRPTKSHEYVFLLTRSPRYFFDQEAVREEAAWERWGDQTNAKHEGSGSAAGWIGSKPKADLTQRRTAHYNTADRYGAGNGGNSGFDGLAAKMRDGEHRGRNIRSVWEIATQPYPEAHFATFPEALPERCIKAGTSEHGCCPECGAPWEREVAIERGQIDRIRNVGGRTDGYTSTRRPAGATDEDMASKRTTTGWHPSCDHDLEPVPCVVLDIFMGSGTVALVARRLGRKSIGIELNPEYARLCARRLQQLSLFAGATDG
jgi:DNA modification methylase